MKIESSGKDNAVKFGDIQVGEICEFSIVFPEATYYLKICNNSAGNCVNLRNNSIAYLSEQDMVLPVKAKVVIEK